MQRPFLARPEKTQIRALPPFAGLARDQVLLLKTAEDVARAQHQLSGATCVGLDTESKPVFLPRQPPSGPHLIQIASEQVAVLCPANFKAGLDLVRSIIESDAVMKVGFGLKLDRGPLQRLLGARGRAFHELSGVVQRLGYRQKVGLQMAVAIVLGQYLQKSKKTTTSNWAAPALSAAQIAYAANDAYASLRVHLALLQIAPVDAAPSSRIDGVRDQLLQRSPAAPPEPRASRSGSLPRARERLGRLLSLVLRHQPQHIGLTLDAQAWAEVDDLLRCLAAHRQPITRAQLDEAVMSDDKQRFAYDATGTRIRAVQGHSLEQRIAYPAAAPPARLFHGTAHRFLASIRRSGLEPRGRQYVHLSENATTATEVGRRYGQPVVLCVDAARMVADGHVFHRADNGVWLTASVPVSYLDV